MHPCYSDTQSKQTTTTFSHQNLGDKMDAHGFENIDFLDSTGYAYEGYAPFSQADSCPSMSSSFLTIDTTAMSFDSAAEDPIGSTSPENLTTSSGTSVTSPATPIGPEGMNGLYNTSVWSKTQYTEPYHHHGVGVGITAGAESLWSNAANFAVADCVMNSFSNQNATMFQPGYFNPETKPRISPDPALSRAVFALPISQHEHVVHEKPLWRYPHVLIPPPTIEPSVTFQSTLPSSPVSELEPVTPLKRHHESSSVFASSPSTIDSTCIPSSRWDVEDTRHGATTQLRPRQHRQDSTHQSHDDIAFQEEDDDDDASFIQAQISRSGVDCEAIIPQNVHACSVAGCVDKDGKPKRFKRQEHRKRHEKTVHAKDAKFPCWVRTGGKACGREFTRRDNLNSHLKKTHGRRSNNQRNSYVATLDERSDYFDEKWKGQLTSDGLPIGHPRWPDIH